MIIVSGPPRSGTSLMMQILDAGGVDIFTDGVRPADVHNQLGYFEHEFVKQMPEDNGWLHDVGDRAVKIVSHWIKFLPQDLTDVRVIMMTRDMDELYHSQQTMRVKLGYEVEPKAEWMPVWGYHIQTALQFLRLRREYDGWRVLLVPYLSYAKQPGAVVEAVEELIGDLYPSLDTKAMKRCWRPNLHRSRG